MVTTTSDNYMRRTEKCVAGMKGITAGRGSRIGGNAVILRYHRRAGVSGRRRQCRDQGRAGEVPEEQLLHPKDDRMADDRKDRGSW